MESQKSQLWPVVTFFLLFYPWLSIYDGEYGLAVLPFLLSTASRLHKRHLTCADTKGSDYVLRCMMVATGVWHVLPGRVRLALGAYCLDFVRSAAILYLVLLARPVMTRLAFRSPTVCFFFLTVHACCLVFDRPFS